MGAYLLVLVLNGLLNRIVRHAYILCDAVSDGISAAVAVLATAKSHISHGEITLDLFCRMIDVYVVYIARLVCQTSGGKKHEKHFKDGVEKVEVIKKTVYHYDKQSSVFKNLNTS